MTYRAVNVPPETTKANGARQGGRLRDELRARLQRAGCFKPAPCAYGIQVALIAGAMVAGYAALLSATGPWERVGLTMLVAFASVQAGFVAHDAGDGAITQNRLAARILRHSLMSFSSALSSSYFNYLHGVHHLVLARGGRGFGAQGYMVNPYEIGWFKRIVSANGVLFLAATVCLRGVTFKLESLRYMAANPARTRPDAFFVAAHYTVWLLVPAYALGPGDAALNYALIALFSGLYGGTILVLNHEGMAAAHGLNSVSMLERVTRTTRNLGASRLAGFLFGGINSHIEHHLFPRIPAARLRKARAITKAFCREHGISYEETGFLAALGKAIRDFRDRPSARLAVEALS